MSTAPKTADTQTMLTEEREQIKARRIGATGHANPTRGHIGLTCSGGGIRSGTLNLGIIQGLAQMGMLPHLDYLSTVSGGGYIGTWLHGVISRYGSGKPGDAVKAKLAPPDFAPPPSDPAGIIEDPIYFLRKFSSYLATDIGLFSADFWTILVIWTRNILLNQAILAPAMALIALAALVVGLLSEAQLQGYVFIVTVSKVAACFLALLVVINGVGGGVSHIVQKDSKNQKRNTSDRTKWAVFISIAMLVISAILASSAHNIIGYQWNFLGPSQPPLLTLAAMACSFFVLFFFLQYRSGFRECCQTRSNSTSLTLFFTLIFPTIAAASTAGALYLALSYINTWNSCNTGCADPGPWHVIAWGPPLVMLVWLFGTGLHIGLMGIDFPDFGREWLSRLGAFLFIAAIGWISVFALFVFGPAWILGFALVHGAYASTLLTGWLATTAAGIFAGTSARTQASGASDQKGNPILDKIAKIAPTVFMVGYLLLIGAAVHLGVRSINHFSAIDRIPPAPAPGLNVEVSGVTPDTAVKITYANQSSPGWIEPLRPISDHYWEVLRGDGPAAVAPAVGILFAACLAVMLGMGLRININEFSIHHFYKNRLVRCYLGASRGARRRGSRLTGFDPNDDIFLADLLPAPPSHSKAVPYFGPYPIINTTLNLNRGSDLAKRERKGSSFVFTPLYSGYEPPASQEDQEEQARREVVANGYRLTRGYSQTEGWGIGTCMAISGAAANPNWGASTSPSVAFLLTIFDVRLGWWVGNTRFEAPSQKPGPKFALIPLMQELFAQTDSRSSFVNLSDGGHFENLGVYELVRRRVPYIIVGDGEQDENYTFESLGGVIRKVRADFGVHIDINPQRIRPVKDLSTTHCVVGKVIYPLLPGEDKPLCGWLLYLKASLTGDEPEDITQYKAAHEAFPHDPTPNQFFTESQFESYRRLGLHIVRSAFEDIETFNPSEAEETFESLYRKWHPPVILADGVASRHADRYSELMKRLCDDSDLAYLDNQILYKGQELSKKEPSKDAKPIPTNADQDVVKRKTYFYCVELIQLMENVWSDLHFSEKANRENPNHSGWMSVFGFWARQEVFKTTWEQAHKTYNPLFRNFFNDLAPEVVKESDSKTGR